VVAQRERTHPEYAHNNIVSNEPPWGGFETFRRLGLEESTVATWLQHAGYRTAMIGKYLNRYVPERDGVPPGWDEWYVGGNAPRELQLRAQREWPDGAVW
jgi:N-acetylglucosamine-6-sulfatase